MAAQGNEAIMAAGNPLNLLISAALTLKSTFLVEAYSLVLMESSGNRAASTDMPAEPPATIETNASRSLNYSEVSRRFFFASVIYGPF